MKRTSKPVSGSIPFLLTFILAATALHAQAVTPPAPDQPRQEAASPSPSPAAATQTAATQTTSPVPASPTPAAATRTASAEPTSSIRIVRLSQIKGAAQMDRNTGRGFEAAFTNLPVVQGAKLRTAEGVAEVEFEDNSTLRLTPNTVVEFPLLRLSPSGATLSTINVLKGSVYVSLARSARSGNSQPNQFTVLFGDDKLLLPPSSHIQLSVANPATRLAVFDGTIQVQDASGATTVGKKKSLLFDPSAKSPPTLVANLEKTPFDDWDKTSVDYHKRVANAAAFGGGSALYGVSDLNYYGSFSNLAGCGQVWRPYFASAAWDPYANGTWAWYPGAGYSWVSPYPWGWAPFHSGQWQLCSSGGWGWRPGGQWNGLVNTPRPVTPSTLGPTRLRPPLPPSPDRPTLVPVNVRPLSVSRLTSADTFVFRGDSAGLGVPREGFGKLNKVSAGVAQHGLVSQPVYSAPGLTPAHSFAQANNGLGVSGRDASDRTGTNVAPRNSAAGVTNAAPVPGRANPSTSPAHSAPSANPSAGWAGASSRSSAPAPSSAPSSGPAPAPSSHASGASPRR